MRNFVFKGSSILILGGGITGRAIARVLGDRGASIAMVDESQSLGKVEEYFPITPMDEAALASWDFAVVSPGWRITHPYIQILRNRNIPIVSEIDLAWQLRNEISPSQIWIGVTGTNGKTSTVEMVAAILKADGRSVFACGNLGETVIEAVTSEVPYDYLVVELSSFQLRWSESPEYFVSAILNFADDHRDWHGTFQEYIHAKLRILDRSRMAILNSDDPLIVTATQGWGGRKVFYSLDTPSPGEIGLVENILIDRAFTAHHEEAEVIAELTDIFPCAPHSVSNSLAAAGLALSVGVSHEIIRSALHDFRPGRHRIEVVLEAKGVIWIDDSKATNPHAAAASLMSQLSVIWVAGGLAKGADMNALISKVRSRVRVAILIGQDRELIATALAQLAPEIPIMRINEKSQDVEGTVMERVVALANQVARPGDAVLLAPACASMDQFISYADRGDQFAAAVMKIASR